MSKGVIARKQGSGRISAGQAGVVTGMNKTGKAHYRTSKMTKTQHFEPTERAEKAYAYSDGFPSKPAWVRGGIEDRIIRMRGEG